MTLLRVENLSTWFKTERGPVHAVTDVSLELERGRTLGLVGESGSGKTTTAYALFGYRRPGSRIRKRSDCGRRARRAHAE